MGAFAVQGQEGNSGGGFGGYGGFSAPGAGDGGGIPGIPSPDSNNMPGVVFDTDGPDIILIIPKTTTPTTSIPPTGVPGIPDASELPEFKIPIVTVDSSDVQSFSDENEPTEEFSEPGDVYVDLTDSNSSDLVDINFESGDVCALPYFFLSFESSIDTSEPFYNSEATSTNLASGDAAETSDGRTENSETNVNENKIPAETLGDILGQIAAFDRNVKLEKSVSSITAVWNNSNQNAIMAASVLNEINQLDFGYYITDTNFKDFSQSTIPQSSEDLFGSSQFDVSGFAETAYSTGEAFGLESTTRYNSQTTDQPQLTLGFFDTSVANNNSSAQALIMSSFF